MAQAGTYSDLSSLQQLGLKTLGAKAIRPSRTSKQRCELENRNSETIGGSRMPLERLCITAPSSQQASGYQLRDCGCAAASQNDNREQSTAKQDSRQQVTEERAAREADCGREGGSRGRSSGPRGRDKFLQNK